MPRNKKVLTKLWFFSFIYKRTFGFWTGHKEQFTQMILLVSAKKNFCHLLKCRWKWNTTTKNDLFEYLQNLIFWFFSDTPKKSTVEFFGFGVSNFPKREVILILGNSIHRRFNQRNNFKGSLFSFIKSAALSNSKIGGFVLF